MKKWMNWILILALICLLFIAVPLTYSSKKNNLELMSMFEDYVEKFNKSYKNSPDEYETRFQHFKASLEEIERLNAEARGPEQHRARYGLTKLSDMSKVEYKEVHLSDEQFRRPPHSYNRSWHQHSHRVSIGQLADPNVVLERRRRAVLPMQVDWRTKGMVGAVHNQGLCGACWAFSTVGVIESMNAIKNGTFEALSVQEVIDCAGLGNMGCSGGDICLLLDWLTVTKSVVEKETDYPLRLVEGTCKVKKNALGVRVSTFTCDDLVGAEDKIIEALATHGPVSVAVNALTWQNYLGGVIQYHCSGLAADLNHAVELVGYDLTAEVPYYIAKNSWGKEFGNDGYLNLAIGSNICGLANEVATVDVI